MRNLVFLKIDCNSGKVNIIDKILTEDLKCKVTIDGDYLNTGVNIVTNRTTVKISFDHFNSLPLFWGKTKDGSIVVSNNHEKVVNEIKPVEIDKIGFWELYLFETPLLSRTLFKGISVSQAGHDLVVDGSGPRLERRFNFNYGKQKPCKSTVDVANNLLSKRLKNSHHNVIFPISGGLDSRIILAYMNESLSSDTNFVTYGFSPKILENIYAQKILQLFYKNDYKHVFHTIEANSYIKAGFRGVLLSGGLAGIQNSHLLGYASRSEHLGFDCILGMFADAIFGYGVSEIESDWSNCKYAIKVDRFKSKGILSDDISEQIFEDLKLLYNDWCDGSDLSSFDEYVYVRERNGKFHTSLINALQEYWNVEAPLVDWEITKYFMSLPNEIRKNKEIVKIILRAYFPDVELIGDVSSSFRNGNSRVLHNISTLLNNILSRKLGVQPVIPIYTDTERHDYSFLKNYESEYHQSIEQMKVHLGLNKDIVKSLKKIRSGMHGFQFISNAQVIRKSQVVTYDE